MIKAFKILLKVQEDTSKWTKDLDIKNPGEVQVGELAFDYKNEELDLKKGATIYFQDDYPKKLMIDGKEYISTNPTNLVCQK